MLEFLSFENHISFFENKNRNIINQVLQEIKTEFENKDKEIFNSKWRKEQKYIPHGSRQRTIITIFGKVIFKRHRYRYWATNKYKFIYPSDLALGIEKYQRINHHLTMKIINLISQGKRYQDILDCFPNVKLNPRTVSNIIKRLKIDNLETIIKNNIKKVNIRKNLYINVDDTFINLKVNNKKHKFRIRVILFHDGYNLDATTNKRNVLNNSRIFAYLVKQKQKINTKKFTKKIYDLANFFYTNVQAAKVIITGDGAPWIRNISNYWEKSIYVLDKFHTFKKIKEIFNHKKSLFKFLYSEIKDNFTQGNYENVMLLLNQNWFDDNKKILKLKKLKNYLKINEFYNKGISHQKETTIGCTIESVISHNIKWLLGYGSKIFSKEIYQKILTLHIAKTNGINLFKIMS